MFHKYFFNWLRVSQADSENLEIGCSYLSCLVGFVSFIYIPFKVDLYEDQGARQRLKATKIL